MLRSLDAVLRLIEELTMEEEVFGHGHQVQVQE